MNIDSPENHLNKPLLITEAMCILKLKNNLNLFSNSKVNIFFSEMFASPMQCKWLVLEQETPST